MRSNEDIFSDQQAVTAAAASSNVLDVGGADVGAGNPIELRCSIDETFLALTHLSVAIRTSATLSGGALVSPKKLFEVSAAQALLSAGMQLKLPAIAGGAEKYLDAYYTPGGSNATAGKISLCVAQSVEANGALPAASPDVP